MARKYIKPAPTPQPDTGADDLFVLMPDADIEVGGRKLTVREYRFIDGMRARSMGKPLTDALLPMIQREPTDVDAEDELDLLAEHQALVRELMADSIEGADADFIDGLSAADGERLLRTWWSVCGRFFVRLALRKLTAQTVRQLLAARAAAGPTSSQTSPPADTAQPTNLATATPSVN